MPEGHAKPHEAQLPGASLDRLFRTARSYNAFEPEAIPGALIREMYELAKWGPTASNGNPARFRFLTTPEAKARLAPHMSSSNRPKTLAAPVNVIIAYDLEFWKLTPKLFPHKPEAGSWFASSPEAAQENALRNGSLQGAYLMMAARSLGLDCGPMSGFNNAKVDAAFFPGGKVKTNFLCNIGYGDHSKIFARSPRFEFDEICKIV
jgi:3-hydroxypropanoate dehydrogenase